MINKIAHVALTVENLEEGIKFYQTLGFSERKRFEKNDPRLKAVFMGKDGTELELFEFEDISDPRVQVTKKHTGLVSDNLEADIDEFVKNGFEIAVPIKAGVTVKRYAFLKDKIGNVFELIEP